MQNPKTEPEDEAWLSTIIPTVTVHQLIIGFFTTFTRFVLCGFCYTLFNSSCFSSRSSLPSSPSDELAMETSLILRPILSFSVLHYLVPRPIPHFSILHSAILSPGPFPAFQYFATIKQQFSVWILFMRIKQVKHWPYIFVLHKIFITPYITMCETL